MEHGHEKFLAYGRIIFDIEQEARDFLADLRHGRQMTHVNVAQVIWAGRKREIESVSNRENQRLQSILHRRNFERILATQYTAFDAPEEAVHQQTDRAVLQRDGDVGLHCANFQSDKGFQS
jgi:hypothetical protein